MNELDQLHKTKAVILTKQQARLRTFQSGLQSVVQRTKSTIQSLGNAELLVARSEIISTLRAIESQSPVLEPQADCMLEVTFDGRHLLDVLNNAGVVSDKSTCAETTSATCEGIHYAVAGSKESFAITAHDAQGRLRELGGDVFVAELQDATGEKKVGVNVMDKGDGTYLATYRVPGDEDWLGNYTLSVCLGGVHIRGSPFAVHVVPLGELATLRPIERRKQRIKMTNFSMFPN